MRESEGASEYQGDQAAATAGGEPGPANPRGADLKRASREFPRWVNRGTTSLRWPTLQKKREKQRDPKEQGSRSSDDRPRSKEPGRQAKPRRMEEEVQESMGGQLWNGREKKFMIDKRTT